MLNDRQRNTLRSLGNALGPDTLTQTLELFDAEHQALVKQQPASETDISYGSDLRHKLDIYQPAASLDGSKRPVVIFIHGGGFLKGDKGSDSHWHNSTVGRCAARDGYIGVVINYRLAPDHVWPSGGEDVAKAVDWVYENIDSYGGDKNNIFLLGTSAGAVHACTFLQLKSQLNAEKPSVKGIILLSGLYGFTPLDERDTLYYGPQESYSERSPKEILVKTKLPLFLACSEFDPPRFQKETLGLLSDRLSEHQRLTPSNIVTGHNHYSLAVHLGGNDTRLWTEIKCFIEDVVNKNI